MQEKQSLAIPVAIVLAGALIGTGIYVSGRQKGGPAPIAGNVPQTTAYRDLTIPAVTSADHIRGSAAASVVLVEYSDTECPFCKNFHSTLQSLISQYDRNTELAWAYRHFPIAQLHPSAAKEAEALECAAEQGKFWEYTDEIYRITPSNNGLSASQLPQIAQTVGLDVTAFNSCLSSGKYAAKVAQQVADAQNAHADGTPTSFLVLKSPLSEARANDILLLNAPLKMPDGTPLVTISRDRGIISMSGAIPIDFVKATVDLIVK